jgi:hypothetical protein
VSRIAWLDPFSGLSGDMMLGALVSAGWPAAEAEGMPARLGLEGVKVRVSEARRGPFAATRVEVTVAEERQPHRHLRHVREILERAQLPAAARARALAAFERLARAEAAVHGSTPEKVHFHEVGAADALVDVAGAMCGLAALGVARVHSRPPLLGTGTVQSEHGLIPVPAPATVRLLEGLPVEIGDLPMEMTTPTGAAILATVVADWGPPPPMRLLASGVGAGGRDPKQRPNVLRLLLGEAVESSLGRRRVAVLETALDDENPQYAAALVPALLEAGALDAMLVPNLMKKGRPGLWLVVVCEPGAAESLAGRILAGSTSLGVRMRLDERFELPRRTVEVATPFGTVTLKVAALPDGEERAHPEFESVRAAAEARGRPLREVAEAALAAWRERPRGR